MCVNRDVQTGIQPRDTAAACEQLDFMDITARV